MLKRIEEDLKVAMKAGNRAKVSTLRLLLAALKNEKIQAHRELTEEEVEAVIRRGVKQRKDSIEQYERGGRADLVAAEKAEMAILESYLPRGLSDAEMEEAIREIISEKGLTSRGQVGVVMKDLMQRYKGRADGKLAQAIAQRLLL
jgi:uncharacterized protein YqeY